MTQSNPTMFEPTADPDWRLDAVDDDALRESSRQSRFALSNGFLGVRGENDPSHRDRFGTASRTLVAGLFETGDGLDAVPTLVPAPDWLQVRLTFGEGEHRLNQWLSQNAFVAWQPVAEPWLVEGEFIGHFTPPLNLQHNSANPFYQVVAGARAKAREDVRSGK